MKLPNFVPVAPPPPAGSSTKPTLEYNNDPSIQFNPIRFMNNGFALTVKSKLTSKYNKICAK
jgi:hypothetical protein